MGQGGWVGEVCMSLCVWVKHFLQDSVSFAESCHNVHFHPWCVCIARLRLSVIHFSDL